MFLICSCDRHHPTRVGSLYRWTLSIDEGGEDVVHETDWLDSWEDGRQECLAVWKGRNDPNPPVEVQW